MRYAVFSLCLALPLLADSPLDEHNRRIRESAGVVDEIMNAGDKSIPRDLLEKAQCVGVVPNLKRAGFIVGGQYGKGVLTRRVREELGLERPSTIR
jgi:lipid-binding SYLF domain-containing protein